MCSILLLAWLGLAFAVNFFASFFYFVKHETIYILTEFPPQTITDEKGTEWSEYLQTNWVEKHLHPHPHTLFRLNEKEAEEIRCIEFCLKCSNSNILMW